MKNIYVIILLTVIVFACKKQTHFIINLNVKSSATNQPLDGSVYLTYKIGGEEKLAYLGEAVDGNLNASKKLPLKVSTADLKMNLGEYFMIPNVQGLNIIKQNVTKGINDLNLTIHPIYRMDISVFNTSCYDATDTAWVRHLNSPLAPPRIFTGCANGLTGNLPIWQHGSTVSFQIITKKNNIQDTITITKNLLSETINQFSLEY